MKTGYKTGTSFEAALADGWCRDLQVNQRIDELMDLGFTVSPEFLEMYDSNRDLEMQKHFGGFMNILVDEKRRFNCESGF